MASTAAEATAEGPTAAAAERTAMAATTEGPTVAATTEESAVATAEGTTMTAAPAARATSTRAAARLGPWAAPRRSLLDRRLRSRERDAWW